MDSSDSCLENTPPSIKETSENVISNINTDENINKVIARLLNYNLFLPLGRTVFKDVIKDTRIKNQ
uniref:Uncharacterized protein n=1 Tax=Rhodnius prolixus TaxID=13249 RepID=T1ID78_RHOPR